MVRKFNKLEAYNLMMNTAALRLVGLTDNEAKIYLDLLRNGSSTAYEIAQRTGPCLFRHRCHR